jgi:hypothetical protein
MGIRIFMDEILVSTSPTGRSMYRSLVARSDIAAGLIARGGGREICRGKVNDVALSGLGLPDSKQMLTWLQYEIVTTQFRIGEHDDRELLVFEAAAARDVEGPDVWCRRRDSAGGSPRAAPRAGSTCPTRSAPLLTAVPAAGDGSPNRVASSGRASPLG